MLGLSVVVALAALSAWLFWPAGSPDVRAGTTLVSAKGLAERFGIEVKLVAVTAAGGIVDLRYQVVDPDKADALLHDPALFPKLVNERTGAKLVIDTPPHNHQAEFELGGTYYFLLPNAKNAIAEGASVTLVIGHARLEHLVAQA